MVATPANAANISSAGIVTFDGTSTFTGSTVTQHAILLGGASNAVASTAVGATGTVLIGNTSADPTYSSTLPTAVQGNITSTGNLGNQLNTTRTAFYVYLASTTGGVIGNSTSSYKVLFDTKEFDQGTDYNTSTNVFTAPVTGIYHFDLCARIGSITAAMTNGDVRLVATGQTIVFNELNAGACQTISTNANLCLVGSCTIKMTAGNTASLQILLVGGVSAAATVLGGLTGGSFFSGYLVC